MTSSLLAGQVTETCRSRVEIDAVDQRAGVGGQRDRLACPLVAGSGPVGAHVLGHLDPVAFNQPLAVMAPNDGGDPA